MNRLQRHHLSVLCLVALAGCFGTAEEPTEQEVAASIQALGVSGGTIPIPAKMTGGVLKPSWPLSYADLLAADALATCWTTQAERAQVGATTDPDLYLSKLSAQMTNSACKTTCSNAAFTKAADIVFCAWLDSRKDPACNLDAASGNQQRALDVGTLRATSETTMYKLPAATGTGGLGLAGTASATVRDRAQEELSRAELNLCMAQQLRQHLDTEQIAFASTAELENLQWLVRDRALGAVQSYGDLGKSFAASGTAPTTINSSAYFIAPLTIWARGSFTGTDFLRMGDDFNAAVSLLIEATENAVELKLRQPAAQTSFGYYNPNNNYNILGPRVDVLDYLIYDPQQFRRLAIKGMSGPEAANLLGLARRADALRFTFSNGTIDRAANAQTLLLAAENRVRNDDCTHRMVSPCTLANASTPQNAYLIWQRFGIDTTHAQQIVDAFATALFGSPSLTTQTSNVWGFSHANLFTAYPFFPQPAFLQPFHILGNHSFTGTVDPNSNTASTGTVVIDKNYKIAPLTPIDLQSTYPQAYMTLRQFNPAWRGGAPQGSAIGVTMDSAGRPRRQRGSSTVLALARESILGLGQLATSVPARGVYSRAASSLGVIESAIGGRQVILRTQATGTADTASCTGCAIPGPSSSATGPWVEADIITKPTDPFTALIVNNALPHAATVSEDAASRSLFGTTRATLSAIPAFSFTNTTLTNGYEQRICSGNTYTATLSPQNFGMTALLRSGTSSSNFKFQHLYTGLFVPPGISMPSVAITFGGRFGQLAERSWQFDGLDWSTPKFDAFGLPRNWAPTADASLQGGAEGEPTDHFLLDRAAVAAEEATRALQQAFDTLEQESIDTSTLAASETRSQELRKLELKSLCGKLTSCKYTGTVVSPTVPACSGNTTQLTYCNNNLAPALRRVTASATLALPLATVVANQLSSDAPQFVDYAGGQLETLMLNQWSAWKRMNGALSSALETAKANGSQIDAAESEAAAAVAEYAATHQEVMAANAELNALGVSTTAEQTQYMSQKTILDNNLAAAKATKDHECFEPAWSDAIASGYSYSSSDRVHPNAYGDSFVGALYSPEFDSDSWSPSALIQQVRHCEQVTADYETAFVNAEPQRKAIDDALKALQAKIDSKGLQHNAIWARESTALARVTSAVQRQGVAYSQREAQTVTSIQTVQDAYAEVLKSIAAINEAFTQADTATSKVALEAALSLYDVRMRFGVRKRFQSLDLWRGRALSENARRLAVAARRAIEARYVVNLSAMNAPEPFVAAPALWADDIYDSDLKPPVAVGLEQRPTTSSGIYANKLVDYVNNLRLFVEGYAVERPTAEVRADAEVIQLPGPAAEVDDSAFDANFSYMDPDSEGWTFYCAASNTWIAHPNSAAFGATPPAWALATACSGAPPTKARYRFWLDPWGRKNGHTSEEPFDDRYNVRLGHIALNVVGSGIRDCGEAEDPSACYAEPFIRYDLQQVGPSLVTDYQQQWHSLAVPTAVIEGGKALATEEWLDPVSNGFNEPTVTSVARMEFQGRPIGAYYTLDIDLPPDVRVERIERIQLLTQTEYWVRQH